ncbi:hypothetical protein PF008_g15114 [Phytophthora fragariae]|uniref:Uncharacterized protein n=1 Tax=Phytophthora fragariae TaxID=53985 RepID=A0A6G0RF20_9STRA|nr:hypothetical protein PF008_g15114 [Phytophthora fragariae]
MHPADFAAVAMPFSQAGTTHAVAARPNPRPLPPSPRCRSYRPRHRPHWLRPRQPGRPPRLRLLVTHLGHTQARIRARKRTAAKLSEVRTEKRRIVANKEAATAAATPAFAVPLGPLAAASTSCATDGPATGPSTARNGGSKSTQGPKAQKVPETPTAGKAVHASRVFKKVPSSGGVGPKSSRPNHERLVTACPTTDPAPDPAQSATPVAAFRPAYTSALPAASNLDQPVAAAPAIHETPAQEAGCVTGLSIPGSASRPALTAPAPESGSGRHVTPAMAGPVIDIDDSENESFLISLQPAARLPHGGSTSTITGLHPREAYVPTQRVHLLVRRPLRTRSSTSQRSSASPTQAQPRRRLPRASTAGTRAAPYLNSAATT